LELKEIVVSEKTVGLDVTKLTLRDALDLATLIEEEALERYEELADQLEKHHTVEAARFFRFMARQEAKHYATLAQRRERLFGDERRTVTRAMLFDVEAPSYDQARAFMSVRQALQAALGSERKARAFFADALKHIPDAQVRTLFEELYREEVEHETLVLKEMDKLPPEPDGDPDDYSDEPVGL
jgi:erythrin-vacuolar iron transport family protein